MHSAWSRNCQKVVRSNERALLRTALSIQMEKLPLIVSYSSCIWMKKSKRITLEFSVPDGFFYGKEKNSRHFLASDRRQKLENFRKRIKRDRGLQRMSPWTIKTIKLLPFFSSNLLASCILHARFVIQNLCYNLSGAKEDFLHKIPKSLGPERILENIGTGNFIAIASLISFGLCS